MATAPESNKAKIAKRVIEVFEFFDNNNRNATVMDIVREYGRPQSSTSELLSSLVEMGLLYKDPRSRTYMPTPRLATLGTVAQPQIIRDGRLFVFMERFAQSSRHSVALFGTVGTHVQLFRWAPGATPIGAELGCGMTDRLSTSAAGQLLLSTMPTDAMGRALRRLNSEASEEERFSYSAMVERVTQFQRQGHSTGDAGFGTNARVTSVLLPQSDLKRPLAIGVFYPADSAVDAGALVTSLKAGVEACRADRGDWDMAPAPSLMRAV